MSAIPQQQIIPEVITHPNVRLDVQSDPAGNVILVADVLGPMDMVIRRLCFPMGAEYAEAIGKKLCAPHVVLAPAGSLNGHGKPG